MKKQKFTFSGVPSCDFVSLVVKLVKLTHCPNPARHSLYPAGVLLCAAWAGNRANPASSTTRCSRDMNHDPMDATARGVAKPAPESSHASELCPNCSAQLKANHCKLSCPQC